MKHISWLKNKLLATRPGPIERPWDIFEIKECGINCVISLSNEDEEIDIKRAKLRHYKFYTEGKRLITIDDKKFFIGQVQDAIDVIHSEITLNNPVLIHCHAGMDRSGFVAGAYFIKYEKFTAEHALEYIRNIMPRYCSSSGYGYDEALKYYYSKL